jgi:hypothetical protein
LVCLWEAAKVGLRWTEVRGCGWSPGNREATSFAWVGRKGKEWPGDLPLVPPGLARNVLGEAGGVS